MNLVQGAYYETDNSDLLMYIIKIRYKNDDYVKVKMTISNKINGIEYQTKTFKLYWKNIIHWKRVDK